MTPALERLQRALARAARVAEADLASKLRALARVHADRAAARSWHATDGLVADVAAALSRLKAAGDLAGRIQVRFGAAPAEPEQFATEIPGVVPAVAFEAAIADLETRAPMGAVELRRLGLAVEDLYGAVTGIGGETLWPHGFGAARALEAEVASRVQERLVAGLRAGTPHEEVAREIARTWDWPATYARTVTRTNYATATTSGRFNEASRVQAAGIRVGFRYSSAGDSDVRSGRPKDNGENHAALDGLVARVDDPVWRQFTPPGGFGCRCVLIPVFGDEVPEGFVRAPAGARFAPGFGTRPAL